MSTILRGFFILNSVGNINFDVDGYALCMIEDGKQFKIRKDEINFACDTINLIVEDTQVRINLPKSKTKRYENRSQNLNDLNNQSDQSYNQNDQSDQNYNQNDQSDQNYYNQNDQSDQNYYNQNDQSDQNYYNQNDQSDQNYNQNDQSDQNYNQNDQSDQRYNQNDLSDQNDQNNQNVYNETTQLFWNDAATKLLLDIYKSKKNLVNTRKIKTYKILWKQIAEIMGQNGYSVTPLQIENKIKSLERSFKNMISNNKKTGRARKTCKYEAELTDLLGEKHNIQPLALSGRNGLVLREQLNSNKENNAIVNNIVDVSEEFNDLNSSNSRAPIENVQNLRKDELQNTHKIRRNTTTAYLSKCQAVLDTYISEKNVEKERNENMQIQILEEFRNIRKAQEDFINCSKKQWDMINSKRDEKNKILKEIAKNLQDIATFSHNQYK